MVWGGDIGRGEVGVLGWGEIMEGFESGVKEFKFNFDDIEGVWKR